MVLLITRVLNIGWIVLTKVRGTTSEEENILDCVLAAIQWIWPWSMNSTRAAVVACVAGWVHDSVILTLLLALVATGAKVPGESVRSNPHNQESTREGKQALSQQKH